MKETVNPELEKVACEFGRVSYGKAGGSLAVKISPTSKLPHALIDKLTKSECRVVLVADPGSDGDVQGQEQLLETATARLEVVVDIGSISSQDDARSFGLAVGTKTMSDAEKLQLLSLAEMAGHLTLFKVGDAPERRGRPRKEGGDDGEGDERSE